MKYTNDPNSEGYVPFPEPHHIRPPYPYPMPRPHANDLEPAFVVKPWEDCCPSTATEECVCVTSGDVLRWDEAAETVSGLDSETISVIKDTTAFKTIVASADFWNDCYDTVSANSGVWNKASGFDDLAEKHLKDTEFLSGKIDDLIDTTNGTYDEFVDLREHLYFDTSASDNKEFHSLTGDGSKGAPYGVNGWEDYKSIKNCWVEISSHMKPIPPADGQPERFIFDGTEYLWGQVTASFASLSSDHLKMLADLSTLEKTNAYTQELANKAIGQHWDYIAGPGINIHDKSTGALRTRVVSLNVNGLNDLPGVSTDIEKIAEDSVIKYLDGKNYVSFINTIYPKSDDDVKNLNKTATIYVAAE